MWGSVPVKNMRRTIEKEEEPVPPQPPMSSTTNDPNVPTKQKKQKREIKVKIEPVEVIVVDGDDVAPSVKKLVAAIESKDKETVKKYRKLIRIGAKAEITRQKRKHQPYKKNKWNIHLDDYRKLHPNISFGQCLVDARTTYKYAQQQ